jgi:hypothetical protein
MGSSGGSGSQNSTQQIAPELRPLFQQTAQGITDLQPLATGAMPDFFNPQAQQIPGFTGGQDLINSFLQQQAFNNPLNNQQQMAQQQLLNTQANPFTDPESQAYQSLLYAKNNPFSSGEREAQGLLSRQANTFFTNPDQQPGRVVARHQGGDGCDPRAGLK